MKTENAILAFGTIILIIAFWFIMHAVLERSENRHALPVIVWNDDLESIPPDGHLIRLELTNNDTIYVGPVEIKPEYVIELISQDSALIFTGTEILRVSADSIQTTIEKDNL